MHGSQLDRSTLRQEFEQLHQAWPWSGLARFGPTTPQSMKPTRSVGTRNVLILWPRPALSNVTCWPAGRRDPDQIQIPDKRDRSDIGSLGCKLHWLSCQYRTCPAFPRRNQSPQQGVLIAPLACLDNHSPRPLFRRPLRGRDPVAEFLGARLRRHSVFPVHECTASHSWTSAMARSTLSCSQYSVWMPLSLVRRRISSSAASRGVSPDPQRCGNAR